VFRVIEAGSKKEKSRFTLAFGALVKRRLMELDLSQAELSRAIGTSGNTVYRIARGQTECFLVMFVSICHALHLDPADVLREILGG
jgi:transcriptional regulator with XRE-family HTH domain